MRLRRARGAAEDTRRSRGAAGDGEARGVTGRGARSPEGDRGTRLCPAGRAWVGASRSLGDLNVRDGVVRRELGGAHDCDRPAEYPPCHAWAAAAHLAHPFSSRERGDAQETGKYQTPGV